MKRIISLLVFLFLSTNISQADENVAINKLLENKCKDLIYSNLPEPSIYENHIKKFYDSNKKIIENPTFKTCSQEGYLQKFFSMNDLQKRFITKVSIDTNNLIAPIFFRKENVYFNHRHIIFVRHLSFEELRLHTLEIQFLNMDNPIYATFINKKNAELFLNSLFDLEKINNQNN